MRCRALLQLLLAVGLFGAPGVLTGKPQPGAKREYPNGLISVYVSGTEYWYNDVMRIGWRLQCCPWGDRVRIYLWHADAYTPFSSWGWVGDIHTYIVDLRSGVFQWQVGTGVQNFPQPGWYQVVVEDWDQVIYGISTPFYIHGWR